MSRSRILSSRFRDRVLVTLKTGAAFDGILYSADKSAIVLRQVSAVGEGENKTNLPLDGELILMLADVAWLQRP